MSNNVSHDTVKALSSLRSASHGLEHLPVLDLVQLPVQTAVIHQLFVRAALADLPVVEDQDGVGGADGGEAVGDDDRGAAVEQGLDGVLDQKLGLGVDRGGGFVED